MKIRSIRLKNLNSLKGEFALSFEQPPLKDCGLFLITGSTGAGKSTILDAITLALFGKIPRYEQVRLTKNEQQILTHGCSDCYAEVEFEVKDKIYRAKWTLAKTRNDTFRPSKRELAECSPDGASSRILTTKKKEIDEQVEELLGGLDFNRFTRSVLLAQGAFASFLKQVDQRSAILERITNSERYSQISTAAYERLQLAKQELAQLEAQMDHLQLLGPEAIAALKEEQQALGQQIETQDQTLQTQQGQLQALEQWEQLQQELTVIQTAQAQLEAEAAAAQSETDLLAQHQKARAFVPQWEALQQVQTEVQQTQQQYNTLEAAQQETQLEVDHTQAQLQQQTTDLAQAKTNLQALEVVYDAVVDLDHKINLQTQHLQKATENLATLEEGLTAAQVQKDQFQEDCNQQQALQQQTQDWLQQHQHHAPLLEESTWSTIEKQWQQLLDQQQKQTNAQEAATALQKRAADSKEKHQEAQIQLEKAQTKLDQQQQAYQTLCQAQHWDDQQPIEQHLEQIKQQNKTQETLLEALQTVKETHRDYQEILKKSDELTAQLTDEQTYLEYLDQRFLQEEQQSQAAYRAKQYYEGIYQRCQQESSLSSLRGTLQPGDPCPLCYSTEQPFRQMGIDVDYALRKATADRNQAEAQWKQAEEAFRTTLADQRAVWRTINKLRQDQQTLQQTLHQQEDQLRQSIQQESTFKTLYWRDIAQLGQTLKQLQQEQKHQQQLEKQLEQHQKALEQAQSEAQIWTKHYQTLDPAYRALQTEHTNKIQEVQRLTQELNSQQQQFQQLIGGYQLPATEMPFDWLKQQQSAYRKQLDQAKAQEAQLAVLQTKLDHQQKAVAQQEQALAEQQTEQATLTQTLDHLKQERQDLYQGPSIKADKKAQTEQFQQLEQHIQTLQQLQQSAQKTVDQQAGQLKGLAQQQQQLQARAQQQETDLLQALQAVDLPDLEAFQTSLLPQALAEQYSQAQAQRQRQLDQLQQQQTDGRKRLQEQEASLAIAPEEKADLVADHTAAQDHQKALLQQLGQIQQQLQQQQQRQTDRQQLLQTIEQHQQEVSHWAALSQFIGNKDGKRFRAFAQSLTLEKLVYYANRYLRTFLDERYHLKKGAITPRSNPNDWLELDIVDTFQLNNTRPVHTLSGGESFLVSLALALALSDLASGRVHIESLFVDEGFGTLDQQTLRLAMRALKSLQAQGKTVGIISHVEQLKQSISPQVQVTKRGGGYSKLVLKEI